MKKMTMDAPAAPCSGNGKNRLPACGCGTETGSKILPMAPDPGAPCCGPSPPPKSPPHERPGYVCHGFVKTFADTPAGPVPVVDTRWDWRDLSGAVAVRSGINRGGYRIAPGLYAAGTPGPEDPVLVTANYKLSFDTLRKALAGIDAWILVLETHGVNVWCAAGKGTFSTREVIGRVRAAGLANVVDHRRLILPQLAATGVSAREVKKGCGFTVVWGPIRARDIGPFLAGGQTAETAMRRVTFTAAERVVLIPVELAALPKPALILLAAVFILSGIGPTVFSFGAAWHRGGMLAAASLSGALAGAVAAPALLPWIPGRAFALKGLWTGLAAALPMLVFFRESTGWLEAGAMLLGVSAISSFLAMNFTGSTPFTSPSGVEKEMRTAIPLQAGAVLASAALWIGSAFAG